MLLSARHQEKNNDKNYNETDENVDDDEYSNETYATAKADHGSIGVGVIDDGKFGFGSFSISHGGDSGGGDGGHGGNHETKSYDGSEGYIGAVVLNNNKRKIVNKKKNGNKQPEFDAATLEAIFGSNGGNNGFPIKGNAYNNTGEQGSFPIGPITGANFEEGTYNNNEPANNALQKGKAVNNVNAGYPNEGNEAQYSKGHEANHNFSGEAGIGSNHGHTKSDNSGNSEEPWIWDK